MIFALGVADRQHTIKPTRTAEALRPPSSTLPDGIAHLPGERFQSAAISSDYRIGRDMGLPISRDLAAQKFAEFGALSINFTCEAYLTSFSRQLRSR